jgi:DNA-binding helix-hairpin-helix protein with protein kinase domain
MLIVLGLIVLQLQTLALGIALFMLLLSGTLLLRLYGRYQASPLLKEKRELQLRAIYLQEQLREEQQRLTEAKKRREHLLRKEQFGLEATLFNLQKHHIEKGLSTHLIRDAVIAGIEPKLKEKLAESGIHTALDISEHAVNQVPGVDAAKRVVLMHWRSTLYAQLDATKPAELPDHQLEYIQKKFQRLHAANDEKERKAANYHQQLKAAWNANELLLEQLASINFWGYLAHTLAAGGSKRVDP